MDNCIFCKIIQGTIPSDRVYQSEDVVAFRDLNPQAPVHVLVVPKNHVPSLDDPRAADGKMLAAVMSGVQKLVKQLNLEKGYRVVANCGSDGGQTVEHIHFHLLGRRLMQWPPG